jgi:glycosyltransferase involved in cell wall biosynthesis
MYNRPIMRSDTCVIIPAFNEAAVISQTIQTVSASFSKIICVNDGSRDDTRARILKSKATLLDHSINLGVGAAIQTGILAGLKDKTIKYFLTFDGDGQHQVSDAELALDHIKKYKLDAVFGSRFLGNAQNISIAKHSFLKLAGSFSAVNTGVKLSDPHIGLRAFSRKFAENLRITMPGYAHQSEVLKQLQKGGYKYAEVPVTVTYSEYSKAKGQPMINSVNIVTDLLFDMITRK